MQPSPPDRFLATPSIPRPRRTRRAARLRARDRGWCVRANRWATRERVRRYFAAISRLGDGVFWYALMGMLVLLDGMRGLAASAHMAATGVVALLLYKRLKHWTKRPRPFAADGRIRAWVAPLDEFSFPSGHTLHAVSFTIVALAWYPWLALLLVPFTASVAVSRVVLGLHYPSDVLAATGIGALLASISLALATVLL
ncbi:phosphatase PAP2 family protein [Pseudoxanthomonas koreensis]|uniref:phosphatase PAP2 family protein n=1 Tax=Pseudoxanthomonas koreensis TaxID=266061 RepID=UPI0013919181|nr:phosphatase PAP2 family protein [Pseudoxanthomonas koreensis]